MTDPEGKGGDGVRTRRRRGARPRDAATLDPHGAELDGVEELPELSDEDLEARIGVRDKVGPVRPVMLRPQRDRPLPPTARRRLLWQDTATIMGGVIISLLAARFLLPAASSSALSSPTPESTEVAVGSVLSSLPAPTEAPTLGDVIDPRLVVHLGATPTPVPVITLPPITPRPSGSPSATAKVTPKPSITPKPTVKPTASPTPTPAPPVASFSCVASTGLVLTCTNLSKNATAWTWHWGDGSTSTTQNAAHTYSNLTYTGGDTVTVTLNVTGPGGSDSQSIPYVLVA